MHWHSVMHTHRQRGEQTMRTQRTLLSISLRRHGQPVRQRGAECAACMELPWTVNMERC